MLFKLGAVLTQVTTPTTPTTTSTTTTIPADVRVRGLPDEISEAAKNIPGSNVLAYVVEGLEGWAIILALLALVVAALIWAFASFTSNQANQTAGRKGVMIAALVVLIVAAAPVLVTWAYNLGREVE